ncbi:hypothetical protein Nmel_017154, partial [Mimus melanotis]
WSIEGGKPNTKSRHNPGRVLLQALKSAFTFTIEILPNFNTTLYLHVSYKSCYRAVQWSLLKQQCFVPLCMSADMKCSKMAEEKK